jgi:hypothetical protein
MLSPQQPDEEAQRASEGARRAAAIRTLLQLPKNREKIDSLVVACLARDIDIHERLQRSLDQRLQKLEANLNPESKHARDLFVRRHELERDMESLRQLVENDNRSATVTERQNQLDELAECIKQQRTDLLEVMQSLKLVWRAIEERRQAATTFKGHIGSLAQTVQGLQRDIGAFLDNIKLQPKMKRNIEDITEVKEIVSSFLSNADKGIENLRLAIADTQNKRDTRENVLAFVGLVEEAKDINTNAHAPNHQPIIQGKQYHRHLDSILIVSRANENKEPRPEPERPVAETPPAVLNFIATYDRFQERYKSKPPKSEPDFIKKFLNRLNVHVSCFFQRHLQLRYPGKVPLDTSGCGQPLSDIFIDLNGLKWMDIRHAMSRIEDLWQIQWAVNEGISGPKPSEKSASNKDNQQLKELGCGLDEQQGLPVLLSRSQQDQHVMTNEASTDELARSSPINEHPPESPVVNEVMSQKGGKRKVSEANCDQLSAAGSSPQPVSRPVKKMSRKKR